MSRKKWGYTRTCIMLPPDMLEKMDAVAKDMDLNRSQLVRRAIATYIGHIAVEP